MRYRNSVQMVLSLNQGLAQLGRGLNNCIHRALFQGKRHVPDSSGTHEQRLRDIRRGFQLSRETPDILHPGLSFA